MTNEWNVCLMLLRRPLLLQHTVWYCSPGIKAAFGPSCSPISCICQQESHPRALGGLINPVKAKWGFFKNYSWKINKLFLFYTKWHSLCPFNYVTFCLSFCQCADFQEFLREVLQK